MNSCISENCEYYDGTRECDVSDDECPLAQKF